MMASQPVPLFGNTGIMVVEPGAEAVYSSLETMALRGSATLTVPMQEPGGVIGDFYLEKKKKDRPPKKTSKDKGGRNEKEKKGASAYLETQSYSVDQPQGVAGYQATMTEVNQASLYPAQSDIAVAVEPIQHADGLEAATYHSVPNSLVASWAAGSQYGATGAPFGIIGDAVAAGTFLEVVMHGNQKGKKEKKNSQDGWKQKGDTGKKKKEKTKKK